MREMKQSRKTRYTQMALRESLLELIQQKPITKITIKEICERADINRTTFYNHYTDQFDLLHKIEDEALKSLEEAYSGLVGNHDTKSMLVILEGIFQYYIDNRRNFEILLNDNSHINFRNQMVQMFFRLFKDQQLAGANLKDVPRNEYFVFILNGAASLIQYWLTREPCLTAKEMVAIMTRLSSWG